MNALEDGVNADEVEGDDLLLEALVMAVSAANPAVAKVVNLIYKAPYLFTLPL